MALHLFTSISARPHPRLLLAGVAMALLSACQSTPSQPAPRATTATATAPMTAAAPQQAAPAASAPPMAGAGDESRSASPLDEAPAAPILGKRTDAHGCKPSTGHAWCERTKRCERPWELALQRGFENTQEGWKAYCEESAR